MNEQFQAAMHEATRLTRAGRLSEATALIQRTLQGAGTVARSDTPDAPPADDIIEGEFRVTEPAPATAAPPALPDARAAELPLPVPTKPWPAKPAPIPAPSSAGIGGRFLSDTYTAQAGTRPYKLYVPRRYRGQALPRGDMPEATGARKPDVLRGQAAAGLTYTQSSYFDAGGQVRVERWLIHGAGHGWSGGSPEGSFTAPRGPDAAREMLRFFLAYPQRAG